MEYLSTCKCLSTKNKTSMLCHGCLKEIEEPTIIHTKLKCPKCHKIPYLCISCLNKPPFNTKKKANALP